MSVQFLLIWTQSRNRFRCFPSLGGISKTYQVFNFEGQNLPEKYTYPFSSSLNTMILEFKQTVGPTFSQPKLLN